MTEPANHLQPGARFPAGVPFPDRDTVTAILAGFGMKPSPDTVIRLIDSTHDADDIRLNYIVDKAFVLRFCNAPGMTEERMLDLSRLIGRYHAMDIRCPQFLPHPDGSYLHTWHSLQYFLSEYIDLPLADGVELRDPDRLVREVQESVARFAEKNRNVDLSKTPGMYSLFDLSPFDLANGIDEKEDNFRTLLRCLRELQQDGLADRLYAKHAEVRTRLRAVYRALPRCVFQGDENFSNVLLSDPDGQRFAGFIDFNLAGTEVIVNQLANLAGFDYDEQQLSPVGAEHRFRYAISHYRTHMIPMLEIYHATETERQALADYAWIVMVAQWPALCFFRDTLEKGGDMREEILGLLDRIAGVGNGLFL